MADRKYVQNRNELTTCVKLDIYKDGYNSRKKNISSWPLCLDYSADKEANFQDRPPRCVHSITSIGKMQSNTTFNICIAKRFIYIACLNSDVFRPRYPSSSGCTLSYYKANYTILTYLLTPWCRVLPEKLPGLQLVKKSPAFHGTRRFITALTSVRHYIIIWLIFS